MKALTTEKKTDGQTYNRAKSDQDSVRYQQKTEPDFVGSGYHPPERFVPLLAKFSHPANATQRVQVFNQLQRQYGNRYVQRVVAAYRAQNAEEEESTLASEIISEKGSRRAFEPANPTVQRMFKSGAIQAKLKIGSPGDKYELEADRIAEQVMRMSNPLVQQSCADSSCLVRPEKKKIIQTKSLASHVTPLIQRRSSEVTSDIQSSVETLKGGGQPLSELTRNYFEPRFGYDFSQVRVHTGNEAGEMNRELNAQAFTHGRDIYFGASRYNPGTLSGKRLLAHELTHAVQQRAVNESADIRVDKIHGVIAGQAKSSPNIQQLEDPGSVGPDIWTSKILQLGSRGPSVEYLQWLLNDAGTSLDVDGIFGPLTQGAVVKFQQADGLLVDGTVGPDTWQALEARDAEIPGGNISELDEVPPGMQPPETEPPKVGGYPKECEGPDYPGLQRMYRCLSWSAEFHTWVPDWCPCPPKHLPPGPTPKDWCKGGEAGQKRSEAYPYIKHPIIGRIYFENMSPDLDLASDEQALQDIADAIAEASLFPEKPLFLEIIGFADNRPTSYRGGNKQLSKDRATNVWHRLAYLLDKRNASNTVFMTPSGAGAAPIPHGGNCADVRVVEIRRLGPEIPKKPRKPKSKADAVQRASEVLESHKNQFTSEEYRQLKYMLKDETTDDRYLDSGDHLHSSLIRHPDLGKTPDPLFKEILERSRFKRTISRQTAFGPDAEPKETVDALKVVHSLIGHTIAYMYEVDAEQQFGRNLTRRQMMLWIEAQVKNSRSIYYNWGEFNF